MGIILTTTFALSIWIVLWSQGFKAFDGFLLAVLLILLAAVGRAVGPLIPGNRED
jgi:hypothetical protein